MRSKELPKINDLKTNDTGEWLNVSRGRNKNIENQKGKRSKSKSFDKSKL